MSFKLRWNIISFLLICNFGCHASDPGETQDRHNNDKRRRIDTISLGPEDLSEQDRNALLAINEIYQLVNKIVRGNTEQFEKIKTFSDIKFNYDSDSPHEGLAVEVRGPIGFDLRSKWGSLRLWGNTAYVENILTLEEKVAGYKAYLEKKAAIIPDEPEDTVAKENFLKQQWRLYELLKKDVKFEFVPAAEDKRPICVGSHVFKNVTEVIDTTRLDDYRGKDTYITYKSLVSDYIITAVKAANGEVINLPYKGKTGPSYLLRAPITSAHGGAGSESLE